MVTTKWANFTAKKTCCLLLGVPSQMPWMNHQTPNTSPKDEETQSG
jgi:hypothetical protein